MYCGTCLTFDGSDDHVTFSSIGTTYEESLTITAWVKTGNTDGWRDVLAGGCGDIIFGVSSADDGTLSFGGQCNIPFSPVAGTTNIADDAWHFICATYDGSTAKIYVDGALDGSASKSGAIDGDTTKSWGGAGSGESWDGELADCRIYDVVLSLQNIVEIYNDSKVIIPSNISQSNLLQHLTFAEGAGIICYDGSGNGNDGTMTNMASADWLTGQTGCPQLITGYNRPMLFGGSGSGDDVKVGDQDSSNMLPTAAVTVSAWAYSPSWSSLSNKRIFSNTEVGGMSLGPRIDGVSGAIFIIRTDKSGGSYTYGTGADTQTLANNTWHHLAATFDGRYMKQYLDGVLKGTVDLGGTYTIQYPTTFSTFFGDECSATNPAGTHNFDGIINEVAVFREALPASEIKALATRSLLGGSLNSAALLNNAVYPMDWVSGASVTGNFKFARNLAVGMSLR